MREPETAQGGANTAGNGRMPVDNRLLEASPDCVKIISTDGKIEFMNSNGRCLMEFDEDVVMTGRPWAELWPEAHRSDVEAAVAAANAGRSSRFTGACATWKGKHKWWDVVVSPIRSDNGEIEVIIVISRDISELKAVEATLVESEQRFRALANTIPQFAWMADPTGRVYWYNDRWLEYTGRTIEEMLGLGWADVHHPDHIDRVKEKYFEALSRGEEWEDVFPLRGRDGEYRWFLSRAMPQRDAGGQPILYCGTNTDITEQRNQSQRLRQLARIVDMSHEAILVWDIDDGIVSWNRGCVELYGYSKAEAVGQPSHVLLKTQHPIAAKEFEQLLISQGWWSGELLHHASDGSRVWVESRQEVIRVGGRKLVLETNRDVTDRRRADEYRDLLVAELNHRVKNTLAIVQSLATQTARTTKSISEFVTSFDGRLHALASAHTVLTDANWTGASIIELVRSQFALYGEAGTRLSYTGEDVFLPPQTALHFTLILHELATNAIKHGALANDTGRVSITWEISSGDPAQLELEWREEGGPAMCENRSKGFGLTLFERSNRLPNLKTRVTFERDGLVARISAQLVKQTGVQQPTLFNPGKKLSVRGGGRGDQGAHSSGVSGARPRPHLRARAH